jgi:hypothetical protein
MTLATVVQLGRAAGVKTTDMSRPAETRIGAIFTGSLG